VGKGNGLGLSICFGIIKRMGGEINVHSTIGKGTRFDIRFPMKNQKGLKTKVLSEKTSKASGE
jgi:two-component system NtrC family sensor kinase